MSNVYYVFSQLVHKQTNKLSNNTKMARNVKKVVQINLNRSRYAAIIDNLEELLQASSKRPGISSSAGSLQASFLVTVSLCESLH